MESKVNTSLTKFKFHYIAVANENEDIKVVKVNVDNAQDLAIQYQVMSIPTTVVIKNGQEVNRAVGMMSKSDLIEMVK